MAANMLDPSLACQPLHPRKEGLVSLEPNLGLGRPIDALCRDNVIDVDDLDSVHKKGKAGKEKWQPTGWVSLEVSSLSLQLGHTQEASVGCHFTFPPAAFVK